MRTKILVLGLVCFILISCYMNYAERLIYYPQPPTVLYDQMVLVLQDLSYTITSDQKTPDPILTKDPYMIAEKGKHKAMITFRREQAETIIEIHISQVGEKVKTQVLEKLRDEIVQKFEERMK